MRGSRMGLIATMIALAGAVAAPFKEAFAIAHAPPPPAAEFGRRSKLRKSSARPSGAAAAKRAARKRRVANARMSKRRS